MALTKLFKVSAEVAEADVQSHVTPMTTVNHTEPGAPIRKVRFNYETFLCCTRFPTCQEIGKEYSDSRHPFVCCSCFIDNEVRFQEIKIYSKSLVDGPRSIP